MSKAHQVRTEDNHDTEFSQLVWQSETKSWKERLTQMNRKLRNAVYPAHVESFWVISMLVMALHFSSKKLPLDVVNIVASYLPR